MTEYMVVTPPYGTLIPILDDGTGPTEYGSDVLYVEARTVKEAKVLAVREWRQMQRRGQWREARWVADQYINNACPFTGLKVFNMDLDDAEFNRRYHKSEGGQ